jgi:uncharacterized heparinase superfamily protein
VRKIGPHEIAFRLSEEFRFTRERLDSLFHVVPRAGRFEGECAYLPVVLFQSFDDREATRKRWIELFPESVRKTVSLADEIVHGKIPIFSDIVDLSGGIDWNVDYRSRKRAPLRFYRDLHAIDAERVGDVKNIWELNRHNFLIHLGKAYFLTGETRYYERWRELVLSWIRANPHNIGINWESSIELAIRAINWIWSSYYFLDNLLLDCELHENLYDALYMHGEHIQHHLSFYFSPNTHLTIEALGLLYMGKSFPRMNNASRWVTQGFDILESQLDRQVLDDGGYFEMATYYHKYTVDLYLHYLVLKGGRDSWPALAGAKIKRLVKHLMLISEPDGTIPLIGDSDGGELLHLGGNKRGAMGACGAIAALLDDGDLRALCGAHLAEEALWLLGPARFDAFGRLNDKPRHSAWHSLNIVSGLFCFRTGMTWGDSFAIVDCGPHGWGSCGHAHSDLLSFEWFCDGTKVIIDPGTYTYSGSRELRDAIRSSQRHNTITIDNVSQSVPGDVFRWKKIAHPKCAYARTHGMIGLFEGEHDAYDAKGVRHRRALIFLGDALTVVVDFLRVWRPNKSLLYSLQFNEGVLEDQGGRLYRFSSVSNAKDYFVRFLAVPECAIAIRDSEIYPDYNKAVPAPRLEVIEHDIRNDRVLVTLLSRDVGSLRSFEIQNQEILSGKCNTSEYEIRIGVHRVEAVLVNGRVVPL